MPDETPQIPGRRSAAGRHSAPVSGSREIPGPEMNGDQEEERTGVARRARARRKAGNPFLLWLKEIATVVAIAIVLSFLIKTFLFRAFYIPSESMVNTLDINDRIFINLLVPEPIALERGDVVVFKDSQGWLEATPKQPPGPFKWVQDGLVFVGLLPDDNEQHLVKRVIGLPGDRVACCDAQGRISINGTPLDETYINPAEIPAPQAFDIVVPDGKIWVMGDNRNHSADSRKHQEANGGFINLEDVEGKATVIAWPLNRWQVLDNHSEVFRNVPEPSSAGQ
ncbi:signal peptidase I [Arthrobacter sp. ISL-30]|uniref:signal peptidase I n=1 Tax=Arthrobacter sp. ISL-30 TaxID=2819109 RepID=UPI001BE60D17|nr:signal peptidase I [Arthrobacter sp. ISL-30]